MPVLPVMLPPLLEEPERDGRGIARIAQLVRPLPNPLGLLSGGPEHSHAGVFGDGFGDGHIQAPVQLGRTPRDAVPETSTGYAERGVS
jgi:hypothetical protein